MVITGPTASGKSQLALDICQHFPGEVIGADSIQVYRHLDIGSCKLLFNQRQGVPHHLVDILEIGQDFNAGLFVSLADKLIQEIHARDRLPLVVGGTQLFIKALLQGLCQAPSVPQSLRNRLKEKAGEEGGLERLYLMLTNLDPASAARINPGDSQRVLRALEVIISSGQPLSVLQQQHQFQQKRYQNLKLAIDLPREKLYKKIDQRAKEIFSDNIIGEVEAVLKAGCSPASKPLQAPGYLEAQQLLRGDIDIEQAIEVTSQKHRNYAKRQITWLRKEREITFIKYPVDIKKIICMIERFLDA